jgi:Carboxylesterase family
MVLLSTSLPANAGITCRDSTATIYTLLAGPITGLKVSGTFKFLGIPYAVPPVGSLRFASPVAYPIAPPLAPYVLAGGRPDCRLNATARSSECAQRSGGSEDCLYLNVFTTTTSIMALRPVLFWYSPPGRCSVGFMGEVLLMGRAWIRCLMGLYLRRATSLSWRLTIGVRFRISEI